MILKTTYPLLFGLSFAFVSLNAFAWTLTTEKGMADYSDRMPNRVQTNNGIDGGRPTVTRQNLPQTPLVLPKIISAAELPVGMAIEINEGEYLTSKGLYKKLDNGAYLTPEGLVIQTESGALIHLQSDAQIVPAD